MLMDFMRRNTKNFLIVLTALIVPSFILWGSFPSLNKKGGGPDALIVVGKEKVSLEQFERDYYRMREMARMNMGGNYNEELEKLLNIKQQVVDGIIRDILFRQEADRLKLVVSDQEVQESLKQNPAFQTDDEFDPAKWNEAIKSTQIDWNSIIEGERESLRNQKLMDLIYSAARVTEDELKEEYQRQNEKAKIKYVTLDAADFLKDVQLTEDQVSSYYEQHKSEYVEPAQVKLEFVEIKKEPSAMDFADIEAFAKNKLEEAKAGADFAEMAQLLSDDPATKSKGGDLGFFSRGNPRAKAIEQQAFSLKEGEISDLIRAEDGFHIIKVEETKGTGDKKQARARDIFFKVEPTEDTLLTLQERAASLSHEAAASSLKEAASKMDMQVKSTPQFEEKAPFIPSIGPAPEISEILPGLEVGKASSVVETPRAYYILQVGERQPERTPELSEVKEKVTGAAKTEEALNLAKAKADGLLKEVNEKRMDLAKASPRAQEALPFTRRGYPPELPRVDGLVEAAFALENGKTAGPFSDQTRVCIVQLIEKEEPDSAGFEAQKDSIEQRMLAQRKQEVFQEYYENLKQQAEVQIDEALLASI